MGSTLGPKSIVIIPQGRIRSYGALGCTDEDVSKLSTAMDSLIAVDLSSRDLNVPYQHAVTPELVLVLEPRRLADDCCNNIRSDQTDPRDRHKVSDGTILLLIRLKPIEVFVNRRLGRLFQAGVADF